MNYNNYYKPKEIILIPKNNDKNNFKNINKIDIKTNKNNTYENIREIVLENSNQNVKKEINIEKPKTNKLKNNIV